MARDDGAEGDGAAPLDDLAERIRSRRDGEPGGAPADAADPGAVFRVESYEAVDADDLWGALDATPDAPRAEAGDGPAEHVVPKRSYCQRCPKGAFSPPPDVHCTHPGTTILEFADIDHVRVRNCPVAAEREAIGQEEDGPVTPGTFGGR